MNPPLEYIAGFFDGEGSIGVYPDGRGRQHLRTQLAQNVTPASEMLFEYLQARWGGNLGRDHNRIGTCFNWQLNSDGAARFLSSIRPLLILKKQQAVIASLWYSFRPPAERNEKGHFIKSRYEMDEEVHNLLKRLKNTMASDDEVFLLLRKMLNDESWSVVT